MIKLIQLNWVKSDRVGGLIMMLILFLRRKKDQEIEKWRKEGKRRKIDRKKS